MLNGASFEPLVGHARREDRVVEARTGLRDLGERLAGPPRHVLVGHMAGHPLGPEREDGVGIDVLDDRAHLLGAGRIEARLHVDVHRALEEVVLLHAEDVEAPEEFGGSDVAHGLGRPPLLVHQPALTARRGDVDDPLARLHRGRHQPGGEIDVVVGMRPYAQDRPEVGHVDHADGC